MATTLVDNLLVWTTHTDSYGEGMSGRERSQVSEVIQSLGDACVGIGELLMREAVALGASVGVTPEGDVQKAIDVQSESLILEHLEGTPVAFVGSEEQLAPIVLDDTQPLVVVTDPLDGSDNVEINAPVGSIFSIYRRLLDPADVPGESDALDSLLQPGTKQLAAGVVIYGPMTLLLLTVGEGTDLYALQEHASGSSFTLLEQGLKIPKRCSTFAINSSNYRHWPLGYQAYYKDLLAGLDGERDRNFNTRWLGALVAEALRIFLRGGIYLYPGDSRHGYRSGRLRLVYEANPIGMLVDQAGGKTTDGARNVLLLKPTELHQRVPLVFGSIDEVDVVRSYHGLPTGSRSPLFADRGFFLSA